MIERVAPEIDAGRFAAKYVLNEDLRVSALVFCDGHDRVGAALAVRFAGESDWTELRMEPRGQGLDWFDATWRPDRLGTWEYCVEAWVDAFATWRDGLAKKVAARVDVGVELIEGAALVRAAADRSRDRERRYLREAAALLADPSRDDDRMELALSAPLLEHMKACPDRSRAVRYARVLRVEIERERAAVGAWYEFFPRSSAPTPGAHGTLRDAAERLEYVASMGFDVVYLPPVHPIGSTYRKGPDNSPVAGPGDPGSPWAIGAAEGGHEGIHPQLGTVADFAYFVERARAHGLEVALDLAFQCSPDHPWVHKHPEWFRHRPDGTIQYAENPPKKYQDVYPLDFESEHWRELWEELLGVVRVWVERGVKIFRVDNPHTKPFAFWEWLIRSVRADHPDVIFLSEAFTRPPVLHHLAKLGFSQSYTYFTWRNTKWELTEYLTELSRPEVRDYLRPNFFANTPDILHEYLQTGGRAAFQIRVLLAATLAGNYGIYGPPFELCVGQAVGNSEEYAGSEKYQVRHWDLRQSGSLRELIARVNGIRRAHPALVWGELAFLPIDNEQLIAFSRSLPGGDCIVVVVNLDPRFLQAGQLTLPLHELGIDERRPYQMDDLLGGARFLWQGPRNHVQLDPSSMPAHIFCIRRRLKTEKDFDYYL